MAKDFSIYYRSTLPPERPWVDCYWDLFISAYNSSQRVIRAFELAPATEKQWLLCPEYHYDKQEHPRNGRVFAYEECEESEFVTRYASDAGIDFTTVKICVDITGFMRPHLLFLVSYFKYLGVKAFDALYSEPGRYRYKEKTAFSDGPVEVVRPVNGYEAQHDINTSRDILVIGVGYDHELIKQVAEHKDYATIVSLFGFPSLRADMYQESILRASKAGDAVFSRNWEQHAHFAMANDPFAVADALQDIVARNSAKAGITNLYLSPLATKPQALGFGLFYLLAEHRQPTSMIFPFASRYARETSEGMSKVWRYTVELS